MSRIAHLLKLIPYKKLPRDRVKLPERSMNGAYDDQASLKGRTFGAEWHCGMPQSRSRVSRHAGSSSRGPRYLPPADS